MVEKLEKYSKNYVFNGINLFYSEDQLQFNKIVPPLEKRKDIIMTAHLCGHFQTQTTYDRLKDRFYWPYMYKDIAEEISKCMSCVRNEPKRSFHTPAQSIPIGKIFDMVSIDLYYVNIWSYEETALGPRYRVFKQYY